MTGYSELMKYLCNSHFRDANYLSGRVEAITVHVNKQTLPRAVTQSLALSAYMLIDTYFRNLSMSNPLKTILLRL